MYNNWNWLYDPNVLNDIYFFGENEDEENVFIPATLRKERARNAYTVEDRYNSVFYKTYILPSLLQDSQIHNLTDCLGKKFQQ